MQPWVERSVWSLTVLGAAVGGIFFGAWLIQQASGTPADRFASLWLTNATYLNQAARDGLAADDGRLAGQLLRSVQAQTGSMAVLLADGSVSNHYSGSVRSSLQRLDATPLVQADAGPAAETATIARRCIIEAADADSIAGCKGRIEAAWEKQQTAHAAAQAARNEAVRKQVAETRPPKGP
jgi:hypothetical protein